jgi:2'-5' RNA ligase
MERVASHAYSRIPGLDSSLWEYLLVTTPDETVSSKLREVGLAMPGQKKQSKGIFHPYIKLAEFQARESMEETIIRWVQRVCNQQESFTVTLNNYGGFPPATIFVRIQDHQPFRTLASRLKVIDDYIQSNSCPPVKFYNRPNLRIGEQPAEADYGKALFHYSQQDFHEAFVVSELVLLKSHNVFEQPKQVNVFRLYPPDTNKHPYVA